MADLRNYGVVTSPRDARQFLPLFGFCTSWSTIVSKTEDVKRGIWDMVLVEGGYCGAEESDGT